MNKVELSGYLGKDPILKFLPDTGKAVTTFTVSVPGRKKDDKMQYDYIRCVAWGTQAEFIANNWAKIKYVEVSGRISNRKYDKDGSTKYITEIVIDYFQVLQWNNEENGQMTELGYMEVDGDIPF